MNLEGKITQCNNRNYFEHKQDIIDLLCDILGEEYRDITTSTVNNSAIYYIVNKTELEVYLESEGIEYNDVGFIKYFIRKIESFKNIDEMNNEELLAYASTLEDPFIRYLVNAVYKLSSYDIYIDRAFEAIRKRHNQIAPIDSETYIVGKFETKKSTKTILVPLYHKCFPPDIIYISTLLEHILNAANVEIDLKYDDIDLGEKVYNKIIYYYSVILAEKLHAKKAYLFDIGTLNVSKTQYETIINEEAFQKLKTYFGNLLGRFLVEPNEVIELVGKDNFYNFALWFIYLSPGLDFNLSYKDEELLKNFDSEEMANHWLIAEEIPDMDIMEVLDEMYLEYLRHQNISLTTIDYQKMIETKKIYDAKREEEKREIEEESNFYHLTLLFKYLEKYGNCKIRFYSSTNICDMLYFFIDRYGKIRIIKSVEIYDKPLFNMDKTINHTAELIERIEDCECMEEDYADILALVLYNSLYYKTEISTNRKYRVHVHNPIAKLYRIIMPMFNLDLKNVINLTLGDIGDINVMLLHQNCSAEEPFTPASIELKMETLKKKINEVHDVWKKANNAQNEEKYEAAKSEWLALNRKARR